MEIKEVIDKLCQNPEFKEWKKHDKECYLVHAFKMLDDLNENIWQIGYYNKKNDKITTFFIENDDIKIIPEEEVYKKEKKEIKKLDIKKVKISMQDSLKKANELLKNKYKESSMKTVLILQNIDEGLVWNITFVTNSFKTLNVKIDANNGKILKHELTPLMEFKAG